MNDNNAPWTSFGEASLSTSSRIGLVGITACLTLLCLHGVLAPSPAAHGLPADGEACLARPDPSCMGRLAADLQQREPDQGAAEEMITHLARLGLDQRAVQIAAVLPEAKRIEAETTLVVGRIAAAIREAPTAQPDFSLLDSLDTPSRLRARGRLAAFLMGDPHGEELFTRYSVPELDFMESMAVPPPRTSVSKNALEALINDAVREGPVLLDDGSDASKKRAEGSLVDGKRRAVISLVRASRILGRDAPARTAKALVGEASVRETMMMAGLLAQFFKTDQMPLLTAHPDIAGMFLTMLAIGNATEDLRLLAAARAWRGENPLMALQAVRTLWQDSMPASKAYARVIARGMAAAVAARHRYAPGPGLAAAALVSVDLPEEARKILDAEAPPGSTANGNDLGLHVMSLRGIGRGVEARAFLASLPEPSRIPVSIAAAWFMPPGSARSAILDRDISTLPPLLRRAGMRFTTGSRFMMLGERDEAVRQFVLAYQDSRDDKGTPGAGYNTLLMTTRALLAADRPEEAKAAMRRAWQVLPRRGGNAGIYIARYATLWHERFPGFDPLTPGTMPPSR